MNTGMLPGLVAILAIAIAGPVLAQPGMQTPDAQAVEQRGAPSRMRAGPLGDGTANAMAMAPVHPWKGGNERATRPWSAPIGHHQPRAADVSASTSAPPPTLDEEDADVDRKISGICRGC